jgi:hypothetical protein
MWVERVQPLVNELAAKRGRYRTNVPKMRVSDMVALQGIFTRGVIASIERVTSGIYGSGAVTDDGLVNIKLGIPPMRLSAQRYVSETVCPYKGSPWKRTPSNLSDEELAAISFFGAAVATFEPARDPSYWRNEQAEQVGMCRQLMAEYQRALDQVTLAIVSYSWTLASEDICAAFMTAIRQQAASLDNMAENLPTELSADLKGALTAALRASEDATAGIANAAGKTAAWAANQVGRAAGAAADGFFDSANLLTLAAAGVVGYVALKGI